MINESKIVYSPRFKTLLQSIKTPISNKILEIESDDIDTSYNFIDIGDNKDMVTFIPDKKAQELLKVKKAVVTGTAFYLSAANSRMFKRFGFDNPDEKQDPIPEGTTVEIKEEFPSSTRQGVTLCFIVAPNGHKAIINRNSLEIDSDNDVWKKGRSSIKVGRLINGLYKLATNTELVTKELEDFVNLYKSKWEITQNEFLHFDIVDGDDIKKWYLENTYASQNGTLGNSCMKYRQCQRYLEIYVKNPKTVQLIILYDKNGSIKDDKYTSNKIIGRALLWKLDNRKDYYMDRIYTIQDSDMNLFEEFADKNGWIYFNRKDYKLSDKSKGGLLVKIKKDGYDYYPYMDTFVYYNGKSKLCDDMEHFNDVSWEYALDNTDGDASEL